MRNIVKENTNSKSIIDNLVKFLTLDIDTSLIDVVDEPEKDETISGDKLPSDVEAAINKLRKNYGLNITQKHIDKEFKQEGETRKDVGGVNIEAQSEVLKLIKDCKNNYPNVNYPTSIVSGYRSYDQQVTNFGNKAKTRGIDDTQKANTLPGFSQHHTGKAFDIFSTEESWWDANPQIKKWVADNAKKYGFKVTYDKQGPLRIAEPWHLYYIG